MLNATLKASSARAAVASANEPTAQAIASCSCLMGILSGAPASASFTISGRRIRPRLTDARREAGRRCCDGPQYQAIRLPDQLDARDGARLVDLSEAVLVGIPVAQVQADV